MYTNDYQYRVAWCKYCAQDWVEIVRDEKSKNLFFCCSECGNEWTVFGDISKPNTATHNRFYEIDEPSYQEIKYRGWDKYLLEDKSTLLGFIGIALVFENCSTLIENLKTLVSRLINGSAQIQGVVFIKQADSFELERLQFFDNEIDELYEIASQNYNVNIKVLCSLFGLENLTMTIRIQKHDTFYNFLLDFPIQQVMLVYSLGYSKIESRTEKIINFMQEMFDLLKFDYAVCDTEVVINFEPKIFKQIAEKKLYSIALIPDESLGSNSLKIIKNERHINIVSSRPK